MTHTLYYTTQKHQFSQIYVTSPWKASRQKAKFSHNNYVAPGKVGFFCHLCAPPTKQFLATQIEMKWQTVIVIRVQKRFCSHSENNNKKKNTEKKLVYHQISTFDRWAKNLQIWKLAIFTTYFYILNWKAHVNSIFSNN